MRQSTRLLIATAVTGIVVAACGGPPPGQVSQLPAPAEVLIDATDFAFTPDTIEVSAGAEATINLANNGTIEHDITVDALSVKIYATPGQTVSGTVTAAAGTYEIYCSIPGHKQAGMVGTLTAN